MKIHSDWLTNQTNQTDRTNQTDQTYPPLTNQPTDWPTDWWTDRQMDKHVDRDETVPKPDAGLAKLLVRRPF